MATPKGFRSLIRRCASRWLADTCGNVGPILALLVVPIIGAFAIAAEGSSWYVIQRSEQNAADSAVITAAINGNPATYQAEARAVTKAFGYTDTVNNTTVTPATVTCPSVTGLVSGTSCYKVSILRTQPIYLSRVVGYTGDRALGTGRGKDLNAYAIAGTITGTKNFCLIASSDLTLGGLNSSDLSGCDIMAGGTMHCAGQNSANGVPHAYALSYQGNSTHCSDNPPVSGYTGASSQLSALSTKVTQNLSGLCSSWIAGGTITSLPNPGGVNCYDGQVTLGSNITVNDPNTVLVIRTTSAASGNGGLDIGAHTLSTASGGSMTIVNTGTNRLNNAVLSSNGGTLDIAAPSGTNTSSIWKGMAFVEDPAMTGKNIGGGTNALDFDFSGGSNNITMNVTGAIYLPNGNFNVHGAIDHASNSDHGGSGDRCIGIVANNIDVNGTGGIFSNPTADCRQAGLSLPTVPMIALLH